MKLTRLISQVDIGKLPLGGGKTISGTYQNETTLVNIIVKNSLTLAGIIFLVLIIAGGIMMMVSAGLGDDKKAATAKSMITNSLIGFLVIFLSYFIIQIIEVITGLSIL